MKIKKHYKAMALLDDLLEEYYRVEKRVKQIDDYIQDVACSENKNSWLNLDNSDYVLAHAHREMLRSLMFILEERLMLNDVGYDYQDPFENIEVIKQEK